MTRAYLDHNATSPVRPEAAAAVAAALAEGGNPSSVHADGRRARARLEAARETIAGRLGARAEDVIFTSGATEAVNLAVTGAAGAFAPTRLLISAIEHDAVREAAEACAADRGLELVTVPVAPDGRLDLAQLGALLNTGDGAALVAVMHANNETGVIQPVAEAARLVKDAGGRLLVDAAQSFGKIPVDRTALGADYLAVSAHKLGGPPGVGALVITPDAPLARRQHGGGQERSRRAGTENVAGIAGFAAAAEAACADDGWERIGGLRDSLEAGVTAALDGVRVWGADAPRLANTSCLGLPGFPGETQVMALDLAGVSVSAGAACSSGKVRASRTLAAMGASPEEAACAIRVSLGWNTTREDVDRFVGAYVQAVERALGPARATAGAA